ncbi:MAG: hypothetical protein FJ279_02965 [Planctomycetes bacterium]|nr:hypothetical protein [Planctomycetota bacterium]
MLPRTTTTALLVLSCAIGASGMAADFPLHKFSYHEGFEAEPPNVQLWAKNGHSLQNFIGPTEEKAFEGKRSLKLDVTLQSGSYHYWGVMMSVPCAGRVKLSARVFVAEETTATVGFGANFVYPPTHHSGCGAFESFSKPTGEWKLVEADLVTRGRAGAAGVISTHTATAQGEDVGVYLDRWSLFIFGGEGRRAVVYVDDVRVEGEAPGQQDYQQDIKERWAKGQARFQKRMDEYRQRLAAAKGALAKMAPPPESIRAAAEAVKANADEAQALLDKFAKTGYGARGEMEALEAAIFSVEYAPETITAIALGKAAGQPYLTYTPRAITNARMSADTFPIPARVGNELSCSGCRGEYESVSLAVYALEDVKGLRVIPGPLKGPGGTIPSSAVDVHVVKSWYQAGKEIWDVRSKRYVPELLLKDDALVRVDREKQENYVRTTAEDGTQTYLLCSGPTSENLADVRPIDAQELQPVDIAANSLKQFWLTVQMPDKARPGTYEGAVSLTTQGGSRAIPLKVTVHPFDLQPSRLIYSIYYRAYLSADGRPTIGSEAKSEEQYRAEIEDLKAHGVLYPTNYQRWDDRRLRRVLEIRKQVGLPGGPFYTLGQGTGAPSTPEQLDALANAVKRWIELLRPFGYDQVYFYGIDEATGEKLKSQRDAWKAVQDAGGKTFVAGYHGTFEAMGKRLNCAVLAGRPDPEEARKWHSVGSHAFTYAFPQVGNEEPETYRRNFGLVLWKAGFDGAMNYAYQHGFNHIWNDFDDKTYRDHNFTYPTVHGVVGTIQWEGFREAVDDVRYVTTLEQAIERAPAAKKQIARQARHWLDALDPQTCDLYETRAEMVRWLLQLRE